MVWDPVVRRHYATGDARTKRPGAGAPGGGMRSPLPHRLAAARLRRTRMTGAAVPSHQRGPGWAPIALAVLTSVLLAGAAVSGYVHAQLVDSRAFSSRVASALDDRALRLVVAERLVDAVTQKTAQNAIVVRPVAVAGVAALVDHPRVRSLFERAVRARHEVLLRGDGRFVLRIAPDDRLLGSIARLAATKATALLRRNVALPVVSLDPRAFELRLAHAVAAVASWRWWLLGAALLAAAACAFLT